MSTLTKNPELGQSILLRLRSAHEQINDSLQMTLLVPLIPRASRAELSAMRDDLSRIIETMQAALVCMEDLPCGIAHWPKNGR